MDEAEKKQVRSDFTDAVNMAPAALSEWLKTEKSKSVGDASGANESTGHKSGRRIVEIKRTAAADLTDSQYAHMKQVVGYVHRHLAQRPKGDVSETNWRYSLMNWGHDPEK